MLGVLTIVHIMLISHSGFHFLIARECKDDSVENMGKCAREVSFFGDHE